MSQQSQKDKEQIEQQIKHMVSFIKQEAIDKANEIAQTAQEDFILEKNRLVLAEKSRIMKEYERKEKNVEVQKRIAHSNEINQSRLKALRAREDALQVIFTEAKSQLTTLSSKTDKYKKLLHRAIIEALIKIDEPEVSIQVRKEDLNIINEVLTNVKQDYTKKTGKSVNLTIDQTNFFTSCYWRRSHMCWWGFTCGC